MVVFDFCRIDYDFKTVKSPESEKKNYLIFFIWFPLQIEMLRISFV
jgi:hypothetical protein